MPEFTQLPVVLRPSRIKQAVLVIVCVVFTVVGLMMIRNGKSMGYVCAGFFGLGALTLGVNMFPNAAYLKLEEHCFTLCTLFRAHTVPWNVVAEFGAYRVKSRKMVGWNYVSSYKEKSGLRSVNRGLTGYEAALPDTYGLKAADLAESMDALLSRYGGGGETLAFVLNGEAKTL